MEIKIGIMIIIVVIWCLVKWEIRKAREEIEDEMMMIASRIKQIEEMKEIEEQWNDAITGQIVKLYDLIGKERKRR